MKFGDYFIAKEGTHFCVRRMVYLEAGKRKSVRLPRAKYKTIGSKRELEKFLTVLNGRKKTKEVKLAFLPPHLIERFRETLEIEVSNQENARSSFEAFKNQVVRFFVENHRINDPTSWPTKQVEWGRELLSQNKSVRTIRLYIQVANRFLRFLHQIDARTYPLVQLSPISRARFKGLVRRSVEIRRSSGVIFM